MQREPNAQKKKGADRMARVCQAVLVMIFASIPSLNAQMSGWGKDEVVKYTPKWQGERFEDGRPRVPDSVIDRLENATSEEAAWGPLRREGYLHQWEGGWQILNSHKRLVGRVFTAKYMPGREEISTIIEAEAQARGDSQSNVRVMDLLQPGDVVIVDHYANIVHGVFTGDNLAAAIYARTGKGYVNNGGIRDVEGTEPLGFPIYFRAPFPGTFPGRMLVGINVPIQIGEVTVMPGDVVVGDKEGLTFIPAHLAEKVAEHHEATSLVDEWRKEKYLSSGGSIKPSELYGRIAFQNPAYSRECYEYVSRKFREEGKTPPVPSEETPICGLRSRQ